MGTRSASNVCPRGIELACQTTLSSMTAIESSLPQRISTVRAGQERGLGTLDYRSLDPREVALS